MPKAIRIHKNGGTDVLTLEDVKAPKAGEGQLLIEQKAIGINYIDIYYRTGLYELPHLPSSLGIEGAGKVLAVGAGVEGFKVGDRVAYATAPVGAYQEVRTIPASTAITLPDNISYEIAAAVMAKGLTAHYLCRRTYIVNPKSTVLIHAAAGGVGLLLSQWCKALGAKVLGTVGSAPKAKVAAENGCDYVINYNRENFVEKVREYTDGNGVSVVYDSVGQATFQGSIDALHAFGTLVSFGQSSGALPPIDIGILAKKSLFLTRPRLQDYKRSRLELSVSAKELFEMISNGHLKIRINKKYKLEDAAQAHKDLESRNSVGSNIFVL